MCCCLLFHPIVLCKITYQDTYLPFLWQYATEDTKYKWMQWPELKEGIWWLCMFIWQHEGCAQNRKKQTRDFAHCLVNIHSLQGMWLRNVHKRTILLYILSLYILSSWWLCTEEKMYRIKCVWQQMKQLWWIHIPQHPLVIIHILIGQCANPPVDHANLCIFSMPSWEYAQLLVCIFPVNSHWFQHLYTWPDVTKGKGRQKAVGSRSLKEQQEKGRRDQIKKEWRRQMDRCGKVKDYRQGEVVKKEWSTAAFPI